MDTWISEEDAREKILAGIVGLESETLSIDKIRGRILAEDIVSPIDVPAFDNSAMDGFAFSKSEDWQSALTCVGTSAAGAPFSGTLSKGEAIRIMTGAAVPSECDTVVPVENASFNENERSVSFLTEPKIGAHIRRKATYLGKDKIAIAKGTTIDAGVISVLASFGKAEVKVIRKVRVSIITTGDELVPVDVEPEFGQIRNSNAHMLEALIEDAGAHPIRYDIAPDDPQKIKERFEEAIAASDIVLSVGGVSMGEFDFVRDTILVLTNSPAFWKVKVKPGKPLTYGRVGRTHLLGLPGNPMSSFVSFHLFAKPLISALNGKIYSKKESYVHCGEDIKSTPKRKEFISGRLEHGEDGPVFYRIGTSSSGDPTAMAGCTTFAVSPIGESFMKHGDSILIQALKD